MDRNRVTVRYAKALIELAAEQKVLEQVDKDITLLFTALDQYQGFADYIENPGINTSTKYKRIEALFGNDFHELSMRFIQLVFNNNREEYLKDLCRNIITMAREIRGILAANITTAKDLDKSLVEKLKMTFEGKLKSQLDLTTSVDENLIGGFVFTIEGQQYDASVATKIKSIKKQLQ